MNANTAKSYSTETRYVKGVAQTRTITKDGDVYTYGRWHSDAMKAYVEIEKMSGVKVEHAWGN